MSFTPDKDLEERLQALLEQRLEGLSCRIQQWLEDSHERAASLSQIIEEARQEPVLAGGGSSSRQAGATPGVLRDIALFAREAEASSDQSAILGRLVSGSAPAAPRVVLFVVRDRKFQGWSARGFTTDFNPRRISLPAAVDNLMSRAYSSSCVVRESPSDGTGNEGFAGLLGGPAPAEMMAAPLWVRDRVAALLYADSGGGGPWHPDAVAVMASLAALSLEALPARAKFPRPAAEPPRPPASPTAARTAAEPSTGAAPPETAEVDPEEERLREDARRFARLLVSEILLYNEQEIEEGRRNKDLYERLKEDIDRSHRMYEQRVPSRVAGAADYFRQELVRVLANGDESAITVPWD